MQPQNRNVGGFQTIANSDVHTSRYNLGAGTIAALLVALLVCNAKAELCFRPSGAHGVRITLATNETTLRLNPALVDQSLPEPTLRLKSGQARTRAKVGQMQVTVTDNPLKVRVEDNQGRLVQEVLLDEATGRITFPLGNGAVLGLGEGADQFDRRGANYPLLNGQVDRLGELGTRIFSPFLIGTEGWALFITSPYEGAGRQAGRSAGLDLRGSQGIFTPSTNAPPGLDLFVIDAHEPANGMSEFARLTGLPAMPPKWALGYMQSHRTLSTEADLLAEARLFRERKLPCDTMIYLGTGFSPAGWNYGHDSFQFNTNVFSRDAAAVIKDLHDLNFKVALHIVPPQRTYPSLHGQIPPATGENLDPRDLGSYWQRHLGVFAAGVDGWWPDEGDWYDIPSRLARHRMYYQGPVNDRPNTRPWQLERNGYPGMAQYDGWYWSGDVQSSWKTLAAQVRVGQNAGLSISPFWGTDTGGFSPAASREYTGELYTRWFQFSAFCPLFRSHGRNWWLHTPYGWDTGQTGPLESTPLPAPSELHNAQVEPICRDYLNLRYQLMPYTYTITREARDTGMPLMRALWLHYPGDANAVARGDEYLWGRDLLVAPVVERAATNRLVYLPQGDWYDWWTGAKTVGGRNVNREVDLKTMPIYVRAGAIIPFDPVRQYADQRVTDPTTLRIYRGADGRFVLYDDDGASLDYLKGAGTWTSFAWNDAQRKLEITLDSQTRTKPAPREFELVLLPDNQHRTVTFSGPRQEVSF